MDFVTLSVDTGPSGICSVEMPGDELASDYDGTVFFLGEETL